jgi:RNA polymerase sigma-70 factor (ECF subfamily)
MPDPRKILAPEPSDAELVRQSRAGSLSAFEELVCRHEGGIFRFLRGCSGNEADAVELTQITFVTAFRALDRYHPAHPFGAWLYTIARRKFIDHCRTASGKVVDADVGETHDPQDPSVILTAREAADETWADARRRLSADQFQALWLKYHDDLSVNDIARVLGRTRTSVKVLLFRARQTLLKAYRDPAGETAIPVPGPNASSQAWIHPVTRNKLPSEVR